MIKTATIQIGRIALTLSLMQGEAMAMNLYHQYGTSIEDQRRIEERIRGNQNQNVGLQQQNGDQLLQQAIAQSLLESSNVVPPPEQFEVDCSTILNNKQQFLSLNGSDIFNKAWNEYVGAENASPTDDQLYNYLSNALDKFAEASGYFDQNQSYSYKRQNMYGTDPRKVNLQNSVQLLLDKLPKDHWMYQRICGHGYNNFDKAQALINVLMEGIFVPRETATHDEQMTNSLILAKVAQKYASRHVQKSYLDNKLIRPTVVRANDNQSFKHELLIAPFMSGLILANQFNDIEDGMNDQRVMKALYRMIWEGEVDETKGISKEDFNKRFRVVNLSIRAKTTIAQKIDVHNFILTVASLLGYYKSKMLGEEDIATDLIIAQAHTTYMNGTGVSISNEIFQKAARVVLSDAQISDVMNDKDPLAQYYNSLYALKNVDYNSGAWTIEAEKRFKEHDPKKTLQRLAQTSLSTTAWERTKAENQFKEEESKITLSNPKSRTYSKEDFTEENQICSWLPTFKYFLETRKDSDDYRAAARYTHINLANSDHVSEILRMAFPGKVEEVFPNGSHEEVLKNLTNLYLEVKASKDITLVMEEQEKPRDLIVEEVVEEEKPKQTDYRLTNEKIEIDIKSKQDEVLETILGKFESKIVNALQAKITARLYGFDGVQKIVWQKISAELSEKIANPMKKSAAEDFLKVKENRTKIKQVLLQVFNEQEDKTGMLQALLGESYNESFLTGLEDK